MAELINNENAVTEEELSEQRLIRREQRRVFHHRRLQLLQIQMLEILRLIPIIQPM